MKLIPIDFYGKTAYVPENAEVEIINKRLYINGRLEDEVEED